MKTKFFFGTRKSDAARIYLSAPTFDCGWYWSFGYLGNSNEHYHLDAYQQASRTIRHDNGLTHLNESRNLSMYDCLMADYNLNPLLLGPDPYRNPLWTFCELALSAYALKKAAEVFGRGGSHMTTNPCAEAIKQPEYVKQINEVILPSVFAAIAVLFEEVAK